MSFLSRRSSRDDSRDADGRGGPDARWQDDREYGDDNWSPDEYFSPQDIRGTRAAPAPSGRGGEHPERPAPERPAPGRGQDNLDSYGDRRGQGSRPARDAGPYSSGPSRDGGSYDSGPYGGGPYGNGGRGGRGRDGLDEYG